mgnify:CR=1 FL=1
MTLWALKCKVRYWKSIRDKFPHIEAEQVQKEITKWENKLKQKQREEN